MRGGARLIAHFAMTLLPLRVTLSLAPVIFFA
jgi:hypothetical protein